jgi:hypothetical protein
LIDKNDGINMPFRIYMNHILDYKSHRFFQSSYDRDEKGTILSVNNDPGTLPTYIGYFLLTLGLIMNMFDSKSRFAKLIKYTKQFNSIAFITILMTFLLALFLALAKRRDDVLLSLQGKSTRKSIEGYNLELINSMLSIMVAVILVAYIMYTMSPVVTSHFKSNKIYLTTIFVLLGMFRYLQITFVLKKSGSPTDMLLKDRFLQLTIFSWLGSFLLIYFIGRQ